MERIYLDNNATTPLFPEVTNLFIEHLHNNFGNASSLHSFGQKSREILNISRMKIANILNANADEIIFTSSGTESNNLAITGFILNHLENSATCADKPHIITSATEHKAILEVIKKLEKRNMVDVSILPVTSTGIIEEKTVVSAIKDNTILISLMTANNETGTIQDIKNITAAIRAKSKNIAIHTDAVQAFGKINIDVKELGIDMLSISSHKINGPKGVGGLFVRRGCKINPIILGGSHEWNLRAGTENIAGIGAFALAAEITIKNKKNSELRDYLQKRILEEIDNTHLNGDLKHRLSNTLNISFQGIEAAALLTRLDMKGIAVSTGSACSSGSTEPSYTLRAMGVSAINAYSAIRFSLGYQNTKDEIDIVVDSLKEIIRKMY